MATNDHAAIDDDRLWITGIGLVTSIGTTREATWRALYRGERGIRDIKLFDTTGQRSRIGATVEGLSEADAPRVAGAWSRSTVLALLAAREALAHARVVPNAPLRVGLVVGGTTGGMFETEARLAELHVDPDSPEALLEMLSHPLTSTGDCLHEAIGPFARVRTLSTACSSGANALVVAAAWLHTGVVDVVVAGGADGLCRLTVSGFNALGALDPEPCRPFDRRRRGLNIGEGAGFVVLERAGGAKARNAEPIAELAGWAMGSEAHHITNPEPSGATAGRLISAALAHAHLDASHVDYVSAHGTGTPLNDPMESAALARALGEHVKRVPVSSSKGQIGHTLAAAGAIEAGIAALVVQKQALVPTAGLEEPDARCDLVHVMHEGREAKIRAVISSSFGFGGMDTALVVTAPGFAPARRPQHRRVVVTGAATLTPVGLRGTSDSRDLVAPASPTPTVSRGARAITLDLAAHLDLTRARRLDRPARIGALVVEKALTEAGALPLDDARRVRASVVLGCPFGDVDGSAAFMHRLFEKGPRFASPAEFPNLVPSSPVGHVSIYLGVTGPVMATMDLGVTGESVCAAAYELVEAGESDLVAGGGYEEASDIVERRIAVLFARNAAGRPRGEGAAAIVFEDEQAARARGARLIAEVTAMKSWRDDATVAPLEGLASPRDAARAVVVLPRVDRDVDVLLDATAWRDVRRLVITDAVGEQDTLGSVAAAAVSTLANGDALEALVVGHARGRGYALHLTGR